MCGLAGWISKDQTIEVERAKSYVVDQYQDQAHRGTEGYGLIEITDDGVVNVFRATTETKMLFDLYGGNSRHILLHHRSPTSSANKIDQTHPIDVEHEELKHRWLIMHNGVITNDKALKEEHEKLGYFYTTAHQVGTTGYYIPKFNDSEAFAIELARYIEGVSKEMATKGGFAFIAVAMDPKTSLVRSVYMGTNGYGAMNIADHKHAWAFASEEVGGEKMKANEYIKFNAIYSKAKNAKNPFLGFEKAEKSVPIEYYVAPLLSPWQRKDVRAEADKKMGFGAHPEEKEEKAEAKTPEKKIEFITYGSIVETVMKSSIGEVFLDTEAAQNDAVAQFPMAEFNKQIELGNLGQAEDIWSTFKEGLGDTIDMADALEVCLDPVAISLPVYPKPEDIIEGGKEVWKRRMARMAKQTLPIFKLATYCECILDLAYQFQGEALMSPDERLAKEREEIARKVDAAYANKNADPDLGLDEQPGEKVGKGEEDFAKDIAEVFPGSNTGGDEYASLVLGRQNQSTGITLIKNGMITEDGRKMIAARDAEYREIPQLKSPAQSMDNDAGMMLQALSETVHDSQPSEVYKDAEDVADTVRQAAEVSIIQQLAEIQALAIESGEHIRIPQKIEKIKEELEKVEKRFTTLAHIVKAAHIKENLDYPYLAG